MNRLNNLIFSILCVMLISCGDREVYYSYRLTNVTDKSVSEAKIITGHRELNFGSLEPMMHASISINMHALKSGGTLEWSDSIGKKNSVRLEAGPLVDKNRGNLDVHYNITIVGQNKIRFECYYDDPDQLSWE